jgi:hypothetical protein
MREQLLRHKPLGELIEYTDTEHVDQLDQRWPSRACTIEDKLIVHTYSRCDDIAMVR